MFGIASLQEVVLCLASGQQISNIEGLCSVPNLLNFNPTGNNHVCFFLSFHDLPWMQRSKGQASKGEHWHHRFKTVWMFESGPTLSHHISPTYTSFSWALNLALIYTSVMPQSVWGKQLLYAKYKRKSGLYSVVICGGKYLCFDYLFGCIVADCLQKLIITQAISGKGLIMQCIW